MNIAPDVGGKDPHDPEKKIICPGESCEIESIVIDKS